MRSQLLTFYAGRDGLRCEARLGAQDSTGVPRAKLGARLRHPFKVHRGCGQACFVCVVCAFRVVCRCVVCVACCCACVCCVSISLGASLECVCCVYSVVVVLCEVRVVCPVHSCWFNAALAHSLSHLCVRVYRVVSRPLTHAQPMARCSQSRTPIPRARR